MSRSRNTPAPSDVAIVGIASCYSQARNTEQFWSNIINKVDAITEVPKDRIDPDAFYDPTPGKEDKIYCKKGGWLGSSYAFNPLKYGTMPRTIEGAEPDQFLGDVELVGEKRQLLRQPLLVHTPAVQQLSHVLP